MLVTASKDGDRDLSSLRTILYGSSPITPAALRRALDVFGPVLVQIWGSTETCGAISQLDATDHDPSGPREYLLRSAGKAYPWFDLKVVEPGTAREVGRGETGEFILRSEQRVSGYHDDPQAGKELVDDEGWLHTGDLGYLDDDGFIFLTDRLKDMIITGGENVYPIEVEAVLSDHPGVASVAVFGAPDERWGERVVAAILAADGQTPSEEELDAFARIHLAPHKRPKNYVFVESFPLTPSGKVLKRELRAQALVGSA